jgi:hypothetical protein
MPSNQMPKRSLKSSDNMERAKYRERYYTSSIKQSCENDDRLFSLFEPHVLPHPLQNSHMETIRLAFADSVELN